MRAVATSFVSGVVFSGGLALAGMTQPAKVINFLDFFGDWDPSLAFVMGGAILVYYVAFRLITKRKTPLLAPRFQIPSRRDIDLPLVGGALLFGAGWGLAGYCPGPGIASLGAGSTPAIVFVMAMATGMALHRARNVFRESRTANESAPPITETRAVATAKRLET